MSQIKNTRNIQTSRADVNVKARDQEKINDFAVGFSEACRLKRNLKALSSEIQDMDDSLSVVDEIELMGTDDDMVGCSIGDLFVYVSFDQAKAMINVRKQQCKVDLNILNGKLDDLKTVLSSLKTDLYSRFGNAINLDDDDEENIL
ncbi:hypothetical protein GJ496_006187 [Pomphorhynchus laevis]|nr:hypothetical protein GJ496_006187 [Pomphorhynchus laevis]